MTSYKPGERFLYRGGIRRRHNELCITTGHIGDTHDWKQVNFQGHTPLNKFVHIKHLIPIPKFEGTKEEIQIATNMYIKLIT